MLGLGLLSALLAMMQYKKKGESKTTLPAPAPSPMPEAGGDAGEAFMRLRRRKGRADTILTGDLVPAEAGARTLLG